MEIRAAVLKGAPSPPELAIAFMLQRWGPQNVPSVELDFLDLMKASGLLNVYHVFQKSRSGIKNLTAGELKTHGYVMSLVDQYG